MNVHEIVNGSITVAVMRFVVVWDVGRVLCMAVYSCVRDLVGMGVVEAAAD